MAYIDICGKSIYYERYGEEHETALLYLHGGPGASCLDFVNTAKRLSRELQVISFDQYGVLRSEAIAESQPYSMDIQADMIEEMRRKLQLERWSVLGHSYGGMLAVFYAQKYPDSVDRIVLECPSLHFPDTVKSIAAYVSDYINQTGDLAAIEHCEKMKTHDYPNDEIFMEVARLLEKVKDKKLQNYLHGVSYEEYLASFSMEGVTNDLWAKSERHVLTLLQEGAMFDNYLPVLKKLGKTTLLLKGAYDPACSERQTRYIRELPHAEVVECPNSGHFPRIEDTEKYLDSIFRFFSKPAAI